MKTWLRLISLITLLLSSAAYVRAAAESSVPAGKPLNRLDVEFETEGSACLDLTHVLQTSNLPWELVEVSPGQFSGLGSVSQSPSDPGIYKIQCNVFGDYRILCQLGSPCGVPSGKYFWPNDAVAADPSPVFQQMSKNMVFESGLDMHQITRLVVAQVHQDQTGRGVFSNVFRIPTEWQQSVRPAVDYIEKHPELLETKTGVQAIGESKSLLLSRNPLIVLEAALMRQRGGVFATDDFQGVLATENPKLTAAVLAIVVSHGWLEMEGNADWLSSRILITSSTDELEGIALGITDAGAIAGHQTQCDTPDGITPITRRDETQNCKLMALVRVRLSQLLPQGTSNDPHWLVVDTCCDLLHE